MKIAFTWIKRNSAAAAIIIAELQHICALKCNLKSLCGNLLLGFFFSCSVKTFAEAQLRPFNVFYEGRAEGLEVSTQRQLIPPSTPSQSFQLTQLSKASLGSIKEQSQFSIGNIKAPLSSERYDYQRKIMGIGKKDSVIFDYAQQQLRFEREKKTLALAPTPVIFDELNYQLQIRRELIESAGLHILGHYHVAYRGRVKPYAFKIVGHERLKTQVGELQTTVLERVRDNRKKKQTRFWLADNWDFVIVKIQHRKKDDTHELTLRQGSVAGQAIKPVP